MGYFYILQDFKAQSYTHLENMPLLIYFIWRTMKGVYEGADEQFKLPIKAADEKPESESSATAVNFLRQIAWLNLLH